jgi:hypothetical protein
MTTYFFTAQGTAAERAERLVMQQRLSREQHSRLIAESRLHLIMGLAGEATLATAASMSPGLFAEFARPPASAPPASLPPGSSTLSSSKSSQASATARTSP